MPTVQAFDTASPIVVPWRNRERPAAAREPKAYPGELAARLDAEFDVALAYLLPSPVAYHGGRIEALQSPLHATEAAFVHGAVERRRQEFTAGRHCARKVFEQLSIPGFALRMGARREPLWPETLTGSISHAAGFCVAAAGPRRQFAGLGVDIEAATPLADSLLELVCRPAEREWCRQQPERLAGLLAKFIFSAKESVFKCLYPVFREELEFDDAEVTLDVHGGRFSATVSRLALGSDTDIELTGRLACTSCLVLTAATLPVSATSPPRPEYPHLHDQDREPPFRYCWQ